MVKVRKGEVLPVVNAAKTQSVEGRLMQCKRPFNTSGSVVRCKDGKFRKWNPICIVPIIR